MKKLIISLVVFIMIITSGITIIKYFKKSSSGIASSIDGIILTVENNDWAKAESGMESIRKKWDSIEKNWAILTDHIEIDNIEMSMIKSSEYIGTKSMSLTLAELQNLKYMVEHIYDKEIINLKNIF